MSSVTQPDSVDGCCSMCLQKIQKEICKSSCNHSQESAGDDRYFVHIFYKNLILLNLNFYFCNQEQKGTSIDVNRLLG